MWRTYRTWELRAAACPLQGEIKDPMLDFFGSCAQVLCAYQWRSGKQERVCAKTALTLKGKCNSCIIGEDESDETLELQKEKVRISNPEARRMPGLSTAP